MIQCIRAGDLDVETRSKYLKQIDLNQSYIRKFVNPDSMLVPLAHGVCRWLSPSPVNTSAWIALIVR